MVDFAEKVNIPDMSHYMRGPDACSLDLMVAVDFTNANGGSGDPAVKGSLHHQAPGGKLNGYETVLSKIGNIFQRYTSRRFNMWGFGAIAAGGSVCHRIPFGSEGEVDGVMGLLTAYGKVVR